MKIIMFWKKTSGIEYRIIKNIWLLVYFKKMTDTEAFEAPKKLLIHHKF